MKSGTHEDIVGHLKTYLKSSKSAKLRMRQGCWSFLLPLRRWETISRYARLEDELYGQYLFTYAFIVKAKLQYQLKNSKNRRTVLTSSTFPTSTSPASDI